MSRLLGIILLLNLASPVSAQQIDVEIRPDAIYFTEGQDSILTYQIADKSLNGQYARSNYIHPLYSLDGEVLTEDFPPDHLHHRGIFWAWHQLYIGDKRIGDGWEIRDFSWDVISAREIEIHGDARGIQTEVIWKSPAWTDGDGNEKAVVRETTRIIVFPARESYRQVDFEISMIAMEADMRIGGSEDAKGYGGFSARIRLAGDMSFTGPDGEVTPENLPVAAAGWLDISGPIGRGGATAGVSILSHPDNPGYPNPWILRRSESMQNAVYPHPGANAVPLSSTRPTTLRYHLLIHTGDGRNLDIQRIFDGYISSRK